MSLTRFLREEMTQIPNTVDVESDAYRYGQNAALAHALASIVVSAGPAIVRNGPGAVRALLQGGRNVATNVMAAIQRARQAAAAFCKNGICPCFAAGTLVRVEGIGLIPIEDVQLGDRVGPASELCDIDTSAWRRVSLRMVVDDRGRADVLEIELLRPQSWLRELQVVPGGRVFLVLDEMNVEGYAEVLSIDDGVDARPGISCPVTGLIRHQSTDVIALGLDSGEEILVTSHHPLFSADRGTWVAAGELEPGEELTTDDQVAFVASLGSYGSSAEALPVYNLEVLGTHVYHVGDAGIVAHNQCHGNSGASQVAQHVYQIMVTNLNTGATTLYKYGISGRNILRNGLSARAQEQVRTLNAVAHAAGHRLVYSSQVIFQIPTQAGARAFALQVERALVNAYRALNKGARPPGNLRP